MRLPRLHRVAAMLLCLPLLLWSLTGLCFAIKPAWLNWPRAYATPRLELPLGDVRNVIPPSALPPDLEQLSLIRLPIGVFYRITRGGRATLTDAHSGVHLTTLTPDQVTTLGLALSQAGGYGSIVRISDDIHSAHIAYQDGTMATIHKQSARVSQTNPATTRIDWLYRLHYLQWTGQATLDKVLGLFGHVLIWLTALAGLGLQRRRKGRTIAADARSTQAAVGANGP